LLLVGGFFSSAWYYSDRVHASALAVDDDVPSFDLLVRAVGNGQVTLERTSKTDAGGDWLAPGIYGLIWFGDNYARVGRILSTADSRVTRELDVSWGIAPQPGEFVRLDSFAYPADPRQALGLAYQNISIAGLQGYLPAWYVPGEAETWLVFVHGKGASRAESLRLLALTSDQGMPALVTTYRNDPGAPRSASRRYDYGASEWQDLEAAVQHALNQGARDVVLAGNSMGGAIVMSFLQRSPLAGKVAGVILDAPVLSFEAVLEYAAEQRRLPGPLTSLTKRLVSLRWSTDWQTVDYLRSASSLRTPIMLLHGEKDLQVPIATSEALARARPDLVTLYRFADAAHVRSWNSDPARYERLVRTFVREVTQAPAGEP
jgi:pimeloyl-ACP methyl ester carboxylesterase